MHNYSEGHTQAGLPFLFYGGENVGQPLIDLYRRDNRTTEQFQKDILYGSLTERNIIDRFVRQYETETGRKVRVEDNGCGNSGELLHRCRVNGKADYTLNGKSVEVKFNRKKLDTFWALYKW
jgi:hypothetical protein